MPQTIVIIGAGLCGGRAALALRDRGFTGRITLVGDEAIGPYERPPLSKQTLLEDMEPKLVVAHAAYAEAGIELITGVPASSIDRQGRNVVLADGRALPYDRLLLATGASARTLAGPAPLRRLSTLRTHADALSIREKIGAGRHLIVIGGGFIGLELAATARQCGTMVTVIEGLPRLMARAVPAEIAAIVEQRHRDEGVDIILGATVASISEDEAEITVTLADGRQIVGDLAVAGIGAAPNTKLAEAAGLAIENGIAVDRHLTTSDPDIFAAGDCCSFPLAVYGERRVRLESWRSAQDQGVLAAANLLGEPQPITDVPWFWSDQYDLTLQIAGLADGAATTVRREIDAETLMLFHLDHDGRLLAASGIGRGNAVARDIRLAEMLIAANSRPSAEALASPTTRLKSLLAA
jgi:3-phenylpropionate/trans-cinnamate dioxygenase ferredoxin reductase component